MDNHYNGADELDDLIQTNHRVMITTKKQNSAYLEMLTKPFIITVDSFKDEDIYTITGECITQDLNLTFGNKE